MAVLFVLLALLAAPVSALWIRSPAAALPWLAGWAALASLATFALYAHDKRAARRADWRTPEATLHLCSLLGGWPGAFLAQRLLRHKNAKPAFLVVFWLTVCLHEFIAIDALRGWPLLHPLLVKI